MKYAQHIILGCGIILAAAGCRTTPQTKIEATSPAPAPTPAPAPAPVPEIVVPQAQLLPLVGLWTKRSSTGEAFEYRISVPPEGALSLSALRTNVSIEGTHFDGEQLKWTERTGDSVEQISARLQPDGKMFVGSSEDGTEFRMTMIPEPPPVVRKPEAPFERTAPLAGVWIKEWFVGGGYEYRLSVAPDGHLTLAASLEGVAIEDLHFDGVKLTWTERAGGLTEQSTARLQPDGVTFVGLAWNAALNTSNKFRMEKVSQ